jgi:hypothetical protein
MTMISSKLNNTRRFMPHERATQVQRVIVRSSADDFANQRIKYRELVL